VELNLLLKGKSVFLDTAPLIYFIEKSPRYHHIVKPVITQIDALETEAITSTCEHLANVFELVAVQSTLEKGICMLLPDFNPRSLS
jgi:hypothetical protein